MEQPHEVQNRRMEVHICSKPLEKKIIKVPTQKHLHALGIASKPDCRNCGMEDETTHHIVCECPAIKLAKAGFASNTQITQIYYMHMNKL